MSEVAGGDGADFQMRGAVFKAPGITRDCGNDGKMSQAPLRVLVLLPEGLQYCLAFLLGPMLDLSVNSLKCHS